jgi:methyltransferase (TIGR00027 family)
MLQVTTTSRWAAAQRARESQLPDGLFKDDLASVLAGPEGTLALEAWEKANPRRYEEGANFVAIRVKFFDDLAQRLIAKGVRQVVIPAAGMDARAFRLDWPANTTVYEIDHPELLEIKEQILKRENVVPKCRRIPVGADLRNDWEKLLMGFGFHDEDPSVWLVEGLLYYFAEETAHRFLGQVSRLASKGSGFGADLVSASTLTSPGMQASLKEMEKNGIGWKFGSDNPEVLLGQYGWSTKALQLGEEGANFGRWTAKVFPLTLEDAPRTFLVDAYKD